jgi:hypothetical protein
MTFRAEGEDPDFDARMADLYAFWRDDLKGQPSLRALERATGGRKSTIETWLKGRSFPNELDPLIKLVNEVHAQAINSGSAADRVAGLFDNELWRRAYRAKSERRAGITRQARVSELGRVALERLSPGWPLDEVRDPFQLELHPAVSSGLGGLSGLTAYVTRDHDRVLGEVTAAAAGGSSQAAVLVGGSMTGKTRACWEALAALREAGGWRLWYPVAPTRPESLLEGLGRV